MKKLWVKELLVNQIVDDSFKVVGLSIREAKNGKKFAAFKATDKTGAIDCIMFDADSDFNGSSLLKEGSVVQLNGVVNEFNNKVNFKIDRVSEVLNAVASNYEKASKYDPEEMWEKFLVHLNSFDSVWFEQIAKDLMHADECKKFIISPAATGMHHAFKHGLLEHTLQMLDIGKKLLGFPFFGEELNKDLCMFGLMFHDFGKIYEYSLEAGFKRTTQGMLVPHIPMVAARILESANKHSIPEMVRDHMMHVVLAHHRRLEWGSPTTFACPEAAFVHYIDNLHGDVFGIIQRREEAKEDSIKYGFSADTCNILAKSFNTIMKDEANEVQISKSDDREKTPVDGF